MSYVVMPHYAFRDTDLVAILRVRHRGLNSHALLSDGSLAKSRTRATTLRRMLEASGRSAKGLIWLNDRRKHPV